MTDALSTAIKSKARVAEFPDKRNVLTISAKAVAELSTRFQTPALEVQQKALRNDIVPMRYLRNLKSYSLADQLLLLTSAVAVIGLGGLGGVVVEILARAGVGSLRLVDGDHFEEHNLNRQLTSSWEKMGTGKSKAAEERVAAINPSLSVKAYPDFLNETNAARLIGTSNVVVDCLDNIKTRFVLEKATKNLGLPLVSAAVGGLYGHVTTIFPEDAGLTMIYGTPEANAAQGAESSLGALPQTVMMIAALQGSEVLKILLGRGGLLRNRMMMADLASNTFELLKLCG